MPRREVLALILARMKQFAKNLGNAETQLLVSFWAFIVKKGSFMGYEPISRCPKILFGEEEGWECRKHFFTIFKTTQNGLIAYWSTELGSTEKTCLVYISPNKTPYFLGKSIADFLKLILYGSAFLDQLTSTEPTENLSKLLAKNRSSFKEFQSIENWLNAQQISPAYPLQALKASRNEFPNIKVWLAERGVQ